AADALLLPSVREGFPTVVAEAMACGTPVIGSNTGGIPEMVLDGRTGFLIANGDFPALVEACGRVIRGEASSMRPACRALAERRLSGCGVAAELRECFRRAGVRHVE